MALDREAIFAALFARLQAKLGTVTVSGQTIREYTRQNKVYTELVQPALVLRKMDETPQQEQTATPVVWQLEAQMQLFLHLSPTDANPDGTLNAWIRALEAALERDPDEDAAPGAAFADPALTTSTTLGGLISGLYFGPVELYQGKEAGQSAVTLEVSMLAVSA